MSISVVSVSRSALAGLTLCLAGASVSAEALESNFSFLIVESDASGEETLVSRNSVKPGEVIHYQLRHENRTEEQMEGLVIAAPVPQGVTVTLGAESTSVAAVFEVQAELDPETDGPERSPTKTAPCTRNRCRRPTSPPSAGASRPR